MAVQPACTVVVSGGLGNQLFQFAAGRALSLRTGATLQLDVSFYDQGRHRSLELDKLPVNASFVSSQGGGGLTAFRRCRSFLRKALRAEKTWREPFFHYDSKFEEITPPVVLEGYFQSERYFAEWQDIIREELCLPEPRDAESRKLASQMAGVSATVLHIRRGDYVTNPKASQIYAACPIEYYRKAMEMIPGNDPMFVFSDDIPWAKANLPDIKPLVFPESDVVRPALADLWLMTQGQHHIIANSSFSWWGAWLSAEPRGLTIAPSRWFNDSSINDHDLIPASWIRI